MQRNHYILISIGIVLLCAMLFFGQRKAAHPSHDTKTDSNQPATPMNPTASIEALDFDQYALKIKNQLSESVKTTLRSLEEKADQSPSAIHYKDLAEFWEGRKELNMAANYYKKAAFLENTEKSVTFAGNLFLAVMQKTEEPEIRKWQALEAIDCFNKALAINPDNVESKIALATCYTEGTGETMKGVTLLREITQKDSNNISANIILGKLAIQSGQLDKAIKRLERVVSLRPDNTEAMYFLAEAYKGQGNKSKAIELFEQCKKLVNNPDFTKEIDSYINSFK